MRRQIRRKAQRQSDMVGTATDTEKGSDKFSAAELVDRSRHCWLVSAEWQLEEMPRCDEWT